MKTLQLISQKLKQWRNDNHNIQPNFQSGTRNQQNFKEENKPSWFQFICKVHPPVMLLIAVSTLTGVVSHRFYNQPKFGVGTISPVRIIAPTDGQFLDEKSTEDLRKKIRNGLIPVLKQDENTTKIIELKLLENLAQIEELRKNIDDIPYISTDIISTSSQKYLQQASLADWQKIQENLKESNLSSDDTETKLPPQGIIAIKELSEYIKKSGLTSFNQLEGKIAQARQNYQTAVNELNNNIKVGELTNREEITLLSLSNENWEKLENQLILAMKRILTQGIANGVPQSVIRKTAEVNIDNNLPPAIQNIAIKLISTNLRANLVIDEQLTKARTEKNAREVKPIIVYVKKDQVIVDVGEEITQADFIALDNLGLSRRSINWTGIAGSGVLVTLSIASLMIVAKIVKGRLRRRDQILLWLLSLSVPVIAVFDPAYISLPAVGFLVSSFYGPTIALTNVTLLTGLTTFQLGMTSWEYVFSSYFSSILAALIASRLRSREELALLGGGVGFIQGSTYFVINLIVSASAGTIWYTLLPSALWQGTVGLTYGVLALGISPYLERFFDLITPIRLAELSNPNRPLLKRLATEAPGTFQHTMFVSSLAEAAARKLHCNVELVRAGTLYHDIGKMHDPLGFIENQMGGPNKHDKIDNPWKSAEIIKKHVSEGIVMAKKSGLPQAIRDFIPQHQGKLLISYFYFQAKNQAEKDGCEIDEDCFRYDGPTPQCRETGIVMLADSCEAALRSLKEATPDQAIAMVNKILKARWRDHQLDDSKIRYEELPIIAEIFVEVWQQHNHQRIAYPKGALEIRTKPKPSPQSQPEMKVKH